MKSRIEVVANLIVVAFAVVVGFVQRSKSKSDRLSLIRMRFAPLLPPALSIALLTFHANGQRLSRTPQTVAPVKPVTEDYHGIGVSDPYRYMEKLDDPAVRSWFKG